jgi:hypothetical protein
MGVTMSESKSQASDKNETRPGLERRAVDLPEPKRALQAEVHFTLGAVIQGVTVAALGNEIAAALRTLPFAGAGWVFLAGFQSLALCIIFWYTFMDNYYFGFRAINLRAAAHFVLATFYLVLGVLQFMAISFLDVPRMWMTFYVLLIAVTLLGSWFTSRLRVVNEEDIRQAMAYDPGSRVFPFTFALAVIWLIIWYAVPQPTAPLFNGVGLAISGLGLVVFTVYSIRAFERHLDVG